MLRNRTTPLSTVIMTVVPEMGYVRGPAGSDPVSVLTRAEPRRAYDSARSVFFVSATRRLAQRDDQNHGKNFQRDEGY